jgi:hypothetical protein
LNGFNRDREHQAPEFGTGWQNAFRSLRDRIPVLSNPERKANKGAPLRLRRYYEIITGEFMKNRADGVYF